MGTLQKSSSIHCDEFTTFMSLSHGGDLTKSPFLSFMVQITLVSLISAALQLFLKPFKQPAYVPQILSGIILGPSLMGSYEKLENRIFPPRSLIVLELYELVAFLLFAYLVGVKTDLQIIKNTSRLAFIIGLTSVIFPIVITVTLAYYLRNTTEMDPTLHKTLPFIALLEGNVSFHAISSLLTDIKLLHSELGRVALSSSMVGGFLSWILTVIVFNIEEDHRIGEKHAVTLTTICKITMILVIVFVFRPILFWMIKQTPEGKTVKESFILTTTLMIFGCAFFGEVTSADFLLGPIIFGLATPDGPPLGSSLLDKLGTFLSVILMPCYIIVVGRKVNVHAMEFTSFMVVETIIVVATVVRFLATIIPCLYFKMPVMDAISLGLLLNCQGIFNVQFFDHAHTFSLISGEALGIMVLMAIVHTAFFIPLVIALYHPSKRYVAYRRRTIEHSKPDNELRILVCIHREEDVPPILRLLEPAKERPMGLYVLDIVELKGHAFPRMVAHPHDKPPAANPTRADRIMKAFNKFEMSTDGKICLQCFSAIAPYTAMHDDICSLGLEKDTRLIIMPFQKSYGLVIRSLHKIVLQMAPCSVGILINCNNSDSRSLKGTSSDIYKICVIFIGGQDDREALAFGTRLAEHPSAKLKVLRIIWDGDNEEINYVERRLDTNAINDFKIQTARNRHVYYKEELVKEAAQAARLFGSLKDDEYDLILVGRRHNEKSPILIGFAIWTEIGELGVVGDMVLSLDLYRTTSILVMQQQAYVVEEMLEPLPTCERSYNLPQFSTRDNKFEYIDKYQP